MPSVSVLVPFAGDGIRGDVWRWLRRRWESRFPDWQLVVGGDRTGVGWSKGRAVEDAARRSDGDLLVIADADSWAPATALEATVGCVEAGDPWGFPHGDVWRLSRAPTARVMSGALDVESLDRASVYRAHPAVAGGGIAVVPRAAYQEVGGIDPRFLGWGGDDEAFGRALDTLVGPHVCLGSILVHLWHPLHPQRRRSPNDRLAGRYLDAVGDPDAMRALVEEWAG